MFAPLYHCSKCGDVWQVEHAEAIDTVNDEVYPYTLCMKCHSEVTPVIHDGLTVCHALDEEEMFWEMQGGEDEDEDDDYEW